MIQKLLKEEFDKLTLKDVGDGDVKKYYDAHPEEFTREELRRAAHIQVATRAEAERLLPQVRAADARQFRTLARDHSVDPETRLRGGDLRYFDATTKELPAPVVKAAFALNLTGDVSNAVDAGNGTFYVLKQTGRRKSMTKSFEDAKPAIRNKLFRDSRMKAQKDFVDNLRAASKIEINEANLARVRIDTSTAVDDGHGHDLTPPPAGGATMPPPPPSAPAAGSGVVTP
jgi:hypothetical protein